MGGRSGAGTYDAIIAPRGDNSTNATYVNS
jgi:hypothetical protein